MRASAPVGWRDAATVAIESRLRASYLFSCLTSVMNKFECFFFCKLLSYSCENHSLPVLPVIVDTSVVML